jgi:drug/metabolite transporter (DMT)-like permease
MFSNLSHQNKAYIFAGIVIFFWSTVATAFKLALVYLEPIQLVLYSTFFSVIVLFLITMMQDKLKLIKNFSKPDLMLCAFLGFLNPCLYYILLFKGYDILPAQEAMVINFSWPIMIIILSIPILKQKIDIKTFLAIIICYLGVVVIASKGDVLSMHFESPLGVGYILITTVVWSLFWLLNTKNTNDSVVSLFLIFLFSLPYIFLIAVLNDDLVIPSVRGLIGSAYIGLFEMGVSVVLWQLALKTSTTVSRGASLVFVTPFLSLLVLYFVLKEAILPSTIIGVILICLGLILQKYFSKKDS